MLVNELLCANVSNMSLCCLCLVHDEHQQTGREGSSESEVRGGQEEVCVCLYMWNHALYCLLYVCLHNVIVPAD